MKKESLILLLLFGIFFFSNCEKKIPNLNGIWVSTDPVDTIRFTSDRDFYRGLSHQSHFNYSLSKDSITIQYEGVLFIYVKPSTHSVRINENQLTIDFRPYCYGFPSQKITYNR